MPIAHGNEIIAVLRETDGLYLARDFVGRHFNVVPPIPHVDDHVVLRADRHNVLVAGRERLRQKDSFVFLCVRSSIAPVNRANQLIQLDKRTTNDAARPMQFQEINIERDRVIMPYRHEAREVIQDYEPQCVNPF